MTAKEIAIKMLKNDSKERLEAEKIMGKKLEDMTVAEKTVVIACLEAFQELY